MSGLSTEADLKLAAIVIVAAVFGGTGTTVLRDQIYPPRPDPFTGSDGRAMAAKISKDMKNFVAAANELSMREIDLKIREIESQLPPPATKKRIRAIETYLEKSSDYNVPTYDWQ